jgi:uncharacterized protein (DUF305 family)
MTLKKRLTVFTLGSTAALLSIGFAACANSAGTQVSHSSPAQDVAQSPMQGMDHGAANMDLGPKDANFDLRFIDAMTPHHQGAVEMAQEALQKSKRPEIKQLAQAIIAAQQQELSQLKAWRQAWYPNADATPMMYDASMGHMMPMTEEMRASMMMQGDLGAADDQFDLRFLNAMIPHHQGATEMARQAAEKSDRPEIKALAQNIISGQQQEISEMQQWRQAWYGQ